jgi:hypothetical protein
VSGRLIALSLVAGIIFPASSAIAALPQQPTAGSGSIGIRLVDVPAAAGDDPLARSYIVDRLAPGTSTRRTVEISNSTRSTADVAIYAAAASFRRGRFAFASGHSRNELSSWTSVSRGVLRLPPGTKAFDTLTIDVPREASSGERYAVIWAEVSAPAPAAGGVTLVNRVGIRMYLSIGPGGAPSSNFVIGSLTAERSVAGEPLVVAKIHNSGQRTLDISGNLTLSKGPGGLRAGPFQVKLARALAPNDSASVTVRLDKRLPRGPWRAQMKLRSGLLQRVAVATITFPRHAGAANPPTARVDAAGSRYLIRVVILLVLLAVAVFALPLARRWARSSTGRSTA